MSILKPISFFVLVSILFSCTGKKNNKQATSPVQLNKTELTKSQKIINKTINAHGGDLYDSAYYSFVFREKTYQFKNDGNSYIYTKTSTIGSDTIIDSLVNNHFKRTVNGKKISLSKKEIASGTGAVNSVVYFATLPYKLKDQAVNSKYIESSMILDKNYDVIEVTFSKDGGGEDYDDAYYYWINKKTKKIDYLAYNYTVNKGGVRFRSAFNRRVVAGITFQDYINYKAPVGTALKDLATLYEAGKLKELSKIKTEAVKKIGI